MDLTQQQIEVEFKRQVMLCAGIGKKKMLQIISEDALLKTLSPELEQRGDELNEVELLRLKEYISTEYHEGSLFYKLFSEHASMKERIKELEAEKAQLRNDLSPFANLLKMIENGVVTLRVNVIPSGIDTTLKGCKTFIEKLKN